MTSKGWKSASLKELFLFNGFHKKAFLLQQKLFSRVFIRTTFQFLTAALPSVSFE